MYSLPMIHFVEDLTTIYYEFNLINDNIKYSPRPRTNPRLSEIQDKMKSASDLSNNWITTSTRFYEGKNNQ